MLWQLLAFQSCPFNVTSMCTFLQLSLCSLKSCSDKGKSDIQRQETKSLPLCPCLRQSLCWNDNKTGVIWGATPVPACWLNHDFISAQNLKSTDECLLVYTTCIIVLSLLLASLKPVSFICYLWIYSAQLPSEVAIISWVCTQHITTPLCPFTSNETPALIQRRSSYWIPQPRGVGRAISPGNKLYQKEVRWAFSVSSTELLV